MNTVGIKAVYQKQVVSDEEGRIYGIFLTQDFLERISILSEYIDENVKIGDTVRLNFKAIPYINKDGKTSAFLGCQVVGVC